MKIEDLRTDSLTIDNAHVYGLEESIVASGLPYRKSHSGEQFFTDVFALKRYWEYEEAVESRCVPDESITGEQRERGAKHEDRARRLASCGGGESHDCYLCGIVVQMNITAPRYWWPEFQRYHFADIISSTSTMHRLKTFVDEYGAAENRGQQERMQELVREHFSSETHLEVIRAFLECARSQTDIVRLKSMLPDGWLQTARVSTNYRQLKTMFRQRKNHPLPEWKSFCQYLTVLPMAELITGRAR